MNEKKRINIPSAHANIQPLSGKEIKEEADRRVSLITQEFSRGLSFTEQYQKSVTFFGSARFSEDNPHYKKAHSIAYKISKLGFAVVTGGGPGIMEAANRGAREAGGRSLAFGIELPEEQIINPYVDDFVSFHYFFSRKVCLSYSAEAYLYFPGGFGTLDEFFEIVTLSQTHKIPRIPIMLVGSDYWKPLDSFLRDMLYERHSTVSKSDFDLYTITDDEETILKMIKNAPMRRE